MSQGSKKPRYIMGPPELVVSESSGESSRLEDIAVLVQSNVGIFDSYRSILAESNCLGLSFSFLLLGIYLICFLKVKKYIFLDAYLVGPVISRSSKNLMNIFFVISSFMVISKSIKQKESKWRSKNFKNWNSINNSKSSYQTLSKFIKKLVKSIGRIIKMGDNL